MNILEEIQNCPVEWKELGEISYFYGGLTGKTKSDFENGNAKYVTYKNIFNNLQVELNLLETVRVDENEKQNSINYGDVLITGSSESKEEVGMSSVVTFIPDEPIYLNSFSFGIRFNEDVELLPEFTKYLFRSFRLRKQIEKTASGVTRYNVSKVTFKKIKVPLLPLEIQEKIVQILDKMTEYVTELTSELTSRKKQYSFYRDKLLSFEDEVYQIEWKMLSECLKKGKGTKITASQMKLLHKDGAPIRIFAGGKTYADVNYGDIPDKDIHTEEAIVVKSRGIIDFEYCTKPFSFKNEFWSYSSDDETINLRYIYHYLVHNKGHFQNIANNMQMPQISSNDTEKFKIPVPSLEIQSRIVQVLDNFDMVCNDLNIGLPKEIELRQKQYEYFREKLLTFVAEGEYTDSTVQYRQDIIRLLNWVFGPILVKLGAVAEYSQKRISVTDLTPETYVGVDNLLQDRKGKTVATFLPEQGSVTTYNQGDILIGNIRPYLKKIWFSNQVGGTSGDVLTIQNSITPCMENKYLYYILSDDRFFYYNVQYSKGSKMPRGDKQAIMQYKFILPSITEQERIVSILDHFNTLTNSLSEGLPKEIELRQKQYEYWREQLLNFTR